MSSRLPVLLGACLFLPLPARAAELKPSPAQAEFFEKSVRPVLADNCFDCHGPRKQKGGLRLDSRAALLSGGDSGPAVVPGKPEKSLLITAVHYADNPRMPPRNKLKPEQIAALTDWVKQGAPWPAAAVEIRPPAPAGRAIRISEKDRNFWSFRPVSDPPLPRVKDGAWPRTTTDHFVLARLEAAGLRPAPQADKRTLIRRATFDLTGLPPTPEEIDAFLADPSPRAFERVVERLLSSPHYGERWARHWLDVARYGEDQAHTFQARHYPYGYRYRDWLVRAFNADLPYDRFIKEQLAADLLSGPDRQENLPALGFFALGPVYYGDRLKLDQYDDRIDTLTRGVLGLTVACARCHDHKFDPIPTRDYYGLAGVFASTDYEEVPVGTPEQVAKAKKEMAAAKGKNKNKNAAPKFPVIHALKEGKPVTLRVHLRGNPATLAEEAPRQFLSVLSHQPRPFTKGSGRLELAEAIASPDNPLTARVMVNRIWQHHFGRGLVRTASNFGKLGEPPTHPELLDHLAKRFVSSGWSVKALHREILLSAAYQQSGQMNEAAWKIDPEDKLLWRFAPRRLEVESWRDAMLAVSGQLDRTLGGPSLDLAKPDNRRRTFYGTVSRHELDPLLRLFDFPDPNITSGERPVTTVPLQQLFVLNSEFMVRNARALAARLAETKGDDAARIRRAFPLLYGRPVTQEELQLGLAFLHAPQAKDGLSRWEQYAQVLLSANEFLYVD